MKRFAPFAGGDVSVEEAGVKDPLRFGGADVGSRPPSGVVAVGVRDYCPVDRHPWVDIEIAGLAVETAVGGAEEIGHFRVVCQDETGQNASHLKLDVITPIIMGYAKGWVTSDKRGGINGESRHRTIGVQAS